jgi:microcystin-dependent protein
MSQPYVGEVRAVGFNFAPVGWASCNGSLLAISENTTLYQLIGTIYGGDGQNTFALPNLQSRIPIHQGQGLGLSQYVIGQTAGLEQVTILSGQYPSHSHTLAASSGGGGSNSPAGNLPASLTNAYKNGNPGAAMNSGMLGAYGGGSQPHDNRQPYLAINWIISLYGIYPSQS